MASLAPAMPSSAAEYREATAAAACPRGSRAPAGCVIFCAAAELGAASAGCAAAGVCRRGGCWSGGVSWPKRRIAERQRTKVQPQREGDRRGQNVPEPGEPKLLPSVSRHSMSSQDRSRQREFRVYCHKFPGNIASNCGLSSAARRRLAELLQRVIGGRVHRSCKSRYGQRTLQSSHAPR